MSYQLNRLFPPPRPLRGGDATPDNAPSETAARALHAHLLAARTKLCHKHDYPDFRERPRGAAPSTVEKYERYEELSGAAGTGAAFAEIGTFSGQPDSIDLVATGGDAFVSLRDRTGRDESALRLIANVPRETRISRHKIYATNVSDASQSTVRATGKWAESYSADTP